MDQLYILYVRSQFNKAFLIKIFRGVVSIPKLPLFFSRTKLGYGFQSSQSLHLLISP